jgi:hypothetical protein
MMNTIPSFVLHVLRISAVAAALVAGYEWCLRAAASWIGVAVLPVGAVLGTLAWAAMAVLAIGPLARGEAERIGLGALVLLLAVRGFLEAVTGAFLGGVSPVLVGATVGVVATVVSDGLPALPRPRRAMRRLAPLVTPPSSLGPALRRAS